MQTASALFVIHVQYISFLNSHNKEHEERGEVPLAEIPFVKEHWKEQ